MDIAAVKAVADRERHELGFVHRGSLLRSVARDELFVACAATAIVGFCQLYRRRDGIVAIYHLAVAPEMRGRGIGRALIAHVQRDASDRGSRAIRLKCPADLPANAFYSRIGYCLIGVEGRRARPLNIWETRSPEKPYAPRTMTPPRRLCHD